MNSSKPSVNLVREDLVRYGAVNPVYDGGEDPSSSQNDRHTSDRPDEKNLRDTYFNEEIQVPTATDVSG